MANKIMVYCKTIDRWFPSIQSAAKFAGVNGWTMGMKMQSSGGFIDANGREYIRKTPMKSKNIYPDYGKTIQKQAKRATRTPQNDVLETTQVSPIVLQLVNDKVESLIKNSSLWSEICKYMDAVGLKKIVITKKD